MAEFNSPFWNSRSAEKQLKALLVSSHDAVLSARDGSNHSALNVAAFRSNVAGVKALIAAGADPNHPDASLHRPLHHSVLGRAPNADVVRALLAAGANSSARAKDGRTALDSARGGVGLGTIVSMLEAAANGAAHTAAHAAPPVEGAAAKVQDGERIAAAHGGRGLTALVVGASRGIGLELVRDLVATAGMIIHATVRNLSAPGEVGKLRGVRLHQLEVLNDAHVRAIVAAVERESLGIDLLLYNAGINQGSLEVQMATNADAPFKVIAALLPAVMRSQWKRVAVITSDLGTADAEKRLRSRCALNASDSLSLCAYSHSKFVANERFRRLEAEWRRDGIVAVALQPGYVSTDMNHGAGKITPAQSARGLVRVCQGLQSRDAGRFLDYRRRAVPW